MMPLPPNLKDRVLDEAKASPSPTRREVVRGFQVSMLFAASLLVALGARAGTRVLATRSWVYNATLSFTFVGVLTLLLLSLAVFARDPLGPARQQLRRRAYLAFPALVLGTLLANSLAPETIAAPAAALGTHIACALMTVAVGAAVAYLGLRVMRGSDPVAPRTTGGAIGVVAGSAAGFAASVPCPHSDPVHMLAGHIVPVVIVAALACALGARMLRPLWRRSGG